MKIALIGNTCNNNFALMRYFRDLGHEADLFLYSTDGLLSENPIHNPEWDTWSINKWKNFIFRMEIPNGLEAVIGRPDKFRLPPKLGHLKKLFSTYDYCIGSGITPSVFWRMGKRLDIFYPYSTGIEWVDESENKKKLRQFNFEWIFRRFVYATQIFGIKSAKFVLNSSQGYTAEVMKNKNIRFKSMHIPQYYNADSLPEVPPNQFLADIILRLERSEFNVFSFMRQLWVYRPDEYALETWPTLNKRNDWLIYGFRDFLNQSNAQNALLFLSSWGPDVAESKNLIERLHLNEFVVWLPILPRRDIDFLLKRAADLGVGEFVCSKAELWGSTGWECIATGIPFIGSVNYSQAEFYSKFGFNLPPFLLNVQKPDDVVKHMLDCLKNKNEFKKKAANNIIWFNKNNGIALAKRWIDLLQMH